MLWLCLMGACAFDSQALVVFDVWVWFTTRVIVGFHVGRLWAIIVLGVGLVSWSYNRHLFEMPLCLLVLDYFRNSHLYGELRCESNTFNAHVSCYFQKVFDYVYRVYLSKISK